MFLHFFVDLDCCSDRRWLGSSRAATKSNFNHWVGSRR